MSRKNSRRTSSTRSEPSTRNEPRVPGLAVFRIPGQLGHELRWLSIPVSVLDECSTGAEEPEIKGVIAGRIQQWLEDV